MKTMIVVLTMALLIILASAFSKKQTPEKTGQEFQNTKDVKITTFDDQLVKMAELTPGFGGMFFDDNGELNVYLLEGEQGLSPELAKAQQSRITENLVAVFGKNFFPQREGQSFDRLGRTERKRSSQIKIIKGDYEIQQLAQWRTGVDQFLNLPGIIFTDLDERRNRVTIGVETKAAVEDVKARLGALGVPPGTVFIEETQPIKLRTTLRDYNRPVQAGFQIEADTGIFSYKRCTLGFTALRSSTLGFVTNSHCTETQGGVEGTVFHQPDDPTFSESNAIGDEIADPQYFVGGTCPVGKRCRFSDSAFVSYKAGISSGKGSIARPTLWNGSITINDASSTFRIVSEAAPPLFGDVLDKVGKTTGWTFGTVSSTCANINVAGTDIRLLCQFSVTRSSGTNSIVDNGDSGSPVFIWMGNDVSLQGILWGGTDDGTLFSFSPINQIEQELGQLTTFNFPPPPTPTPPPPCPRGRKCCEPEGNGCRICVPINAQCP